MTGQYEDFARRFLNVQSSTGSEFLAVCPFHDDHNASFQFNVESGLFVCFSCNVGGNIRRLERKFGVSHRSVGVGLDTIFRLLNDIEHPPAERKTMSEDQLGQFNLPTPYWERKRHFTPATVKQWDLGYDIANDAVTIPVRTMHGELLGVTRRFLDPDALLRYKYPKGFHKREHLFGSWMVAEDETISTVALTEGAIDAMWLWQCGFPAMAVYGSAISEIQISTLKALGIRKVVLFFDNDKAGAALVQQALGWKQSNNRWQKVRELDLRRSFIVEKVDWSGTPKRVKDANDLSERQVKSMFAGTTPLP